MLFSIIIPAYQTQNTLARCLDSVLSQSVQDFQILIVDDGSTDATKGEAARYAAGDSRIQVISTAHFGTGAARNRGLEKAEGEYVLFLDADDYWIREDLLETLRSRIQHHPTDVFMFQMVKVAENGTVLKRYAKPRFYHDNMVLELKDIYQDLVKDGQALASACNKCVRRSLMEQRHVLFREDVLGEDIDWVLQLFSNVQTISLLNLDAYAYTQHHTESRSSSKEAPDDLVTVVADWSQRLSRGNVSHARAVAGLVAFEYGICMGSNHLLSPDRRKAMRANEHMLKYGLDKKTKLIFRFYKLFGYSLTCLAIRLYLLLRKIW